MNNFNLLKTFVQFAAVSAAAFLISCSSLGPKRGSPGRDYFRENFSCKNEPLPQESKPDYQLLYDKYRKKTFQNTEDNVFAVITGDSTSALFFPERLKKFVPGYKIINRGIGGDTTAMLSRRLEEDIISLNPRVVIIEIGGNDILGGRCLSAVLENTENMLNTLLAKLPRSHIILVSVPPVNAWKANSIMPFYNRKLEYLTEKNSRAHYMDLWPNLSETERPRLKKEYRLFLPGGKLDYVHLNEEGYRVWGEMIKNSLSRLNIK